MPDIPLLDVSAWRSGSDPQRGALARRLDGALRRSGFLLIEGHGIDPGLGAAIRAEAARFFALPALLKQRYSAPVGGREGGAEPGDPRLGLGAAGAAACGQGPRPGREGTTRVHIPAVQCMRARRTGKPREPRGLPVRGLRVCLQR
jgi:isopenicillin N synthase-like dioxygenase